MYRYVLALLVAFGGAEFSVSTPALAQNSVRCESRNFKYRECDAGMRRPRIVRQLSRAPCISGDTWGYHRGLVWVDRGCGAVFADAAGRRYYRDYPRYDDRDPRYDDRDPRYDDRYNRRYDDRYYDPDDW